MGILWFSNYTSSSRHFISIIASKAVSVPRIECPTEWTGLLALSLWTYVKPWHTVFTSWPDHIFAVGIDWNTDKTLSIVGESVAREASSAGSIKFVEILAEWIGSTALTIQVYIVSSWTRFTSSITIELFTVRVLEEHLACTRARIETITGIASCACPSTEVRSSTQRIKLFADSIILTVEKSLITLVALLTLETLAVDILRWCYDTLARISAIARIASCTLT